MDTNVLTSTDFHQWTLDTAQAIRERRFHGIDWEKVAEEIEGLGISQETELESRLTQLMYHLLKMEFQPERNSRSWLRSIKDQRSRIDILLRKQPSLKRLLHDSDTLDAAYKDVLPEAIRENLPNSVIEHFPERCPYTVEMLLPELTK